MTTEKAIEVLKDQAEKTRLNFAGYECVNAEAIETLISTVEEARKVLREVVSIENIPETKDKYTKRFISHIIRQYNSLIYKLKNELGVSE